MLLRFGHSFRFGVVRTHPVEQFAARVADVPFAVDIRGKVRAARRGAAVAVFVAVPTFNDRSTRRVRVARHGATVGRGFVGAICVMRTHVIYSRPGMGWPGNAPDQPEFR